MAQEQQKINIYSYYSTIKVKKKKKLRTYYTKGKTYVNSLDLADYLDITNDEAKSLIQFCVEYADYTLYDENDNILEKNTVIWVDKAEADYIINNFSDMGKFR